MSAACPTKVFAVPAISPLTYNDKLQACHPWTMANHARTRILINKQRFSKHFHRFFRGRDSMKGDGRIAAFRCTGHNFRRCGPRQLYLCKGARLGWSSFLAGTSSVPS